MSLNSHEYNSEQSLFVEKIVDAPFQIKKNPEGIPLINGDNIFSLSNWEQVELTKNDKICQHWKKILIITENGVYFKDETKTAFEKIKFDAKNIRVNHKSFEKYGQLFVSSYNDGIDQNKPSFYTFLIDGKIYTTPTAWSMNFWDDTCDVRIKWDKLYAHWWISSDFYIYTINRDTNKLILDYKHSVSEERAWHRWFMLDDWSFGEKYVKGEKTSVKINNVFWKNTMSEYWSSLENDWKNIWLWNREELFINDKKYPLWDRKGEIRTTQLSSDAQWVILSYSYDQYNSEKKGDCILIGNQQWIVKEIPNTFGWVLKTLVKDDNTFAYIAKDSQKGVSLIINWYDYPIHLQDDYDAVKEFSFIDDSTVNIKYIDVQNNLVHKHISLDTHAEEIQKKQEQVEQEKKSKFEMMNWLKEHNISSKEQLQKLFENADKAYRYSQNLQEEQKSSYEKTLEIEQLKSEKTKLSNENSSLTFKLQELELNMKTLKDWISSGTLWYKLSSDAKRILGK